MPIFETLALTLGTSIAKAMIKSWAKDSLIADILPDLVDLLRDRGKDALAQRGDQHQIAQIGEQTAERMKLVFEIEAGGMSKDDRTAVVREVAETLIRTEITAPVLVSHNLQADWLASYLHNTRPDATRDLSAAQTALYQRTLSEASASIVDIAAKLDGFTNNAFASLLQDDNRMLGMLATLLERPDKAAEQFERDYRQVIMEHLDRMEMFGVPRMDALTRRQSLTVAYVTLQCEPRAINGAKPHAETLRELLGENIIPTSHIETEEVDRHSVSVDRLLAQSRRLVVRGEAGSGKTTLLQWIAVRTAKQDFPPNRTSCRLSRWRNNSVIRPAIP